MFVLSFRIESFPTGMYCTLVPCTLLLKNASNKLHLKIIENEQHYSFKQVTHTLLFLHTQKRQVNIGPEFQAEIPDLLEQEEIELSSEEPLWEELLWKPWAELDRNDDLLEQGKYPSKC